MNTAITLIVIGVLLGIFLVLNVRSMTNLAFYALAYFAYGMFWLGSLPLRLLVWLLLQ